MYRLLSANSFLLLLTSLYKRMHDISDHWSCVGNSSKCYRVSTGFLGMWKSYVGREGFSSQQLIPPPTESDRALFLLQRLPPVMRHDSWMKWEDG
jgi:hypothetical protein